MSTKHSQKNLKYDLRVISLGKDGNTQNIQRISFSVGNPKKNKKDAIAGIKTLKEIFSALEDKSKKKRKKKSK